MSRYQLTVLKQHRCAQSQINLACTLVPRRVQLYCQHPSLRQTSGKQFSKPSQFLPSRRAMSSSASVPKATSGIQINKTGGADVLEYKAELPIPELKEGEVIIKHDFIGVNYLDTYFRTGLYPVPNGFPHILGSEAAGTVVSVGNGETYGLKEGDRVVSLGQHAYVEYNTAPAAKVYKLPDSVSTKEAAASFIQGLTAVTLVRESYPVKKGDWILLHAAAGGMGGWLLQLLSQIGARVIATCSTSKISAVESQGGTEAIVDYTAGDDPMKSVLDKVMDLTKGKGVSAVFDGVGKSTFDTSLASLGLGGYLCCFGNASGAPDPVRVARLSPKNVRLMRPTLYVYLEERADFERYSQEVCGLLADKKVSLKIHEVYKLQDVARAHRDLEGRRTMGKLLLEPRCRS